MISFVMEVQLLLRRHRHRHRHRLHWGSNKGMLELGHINKLGLERVWFKSLIREIKDRVR